MGKPYPMTPRKVKPVRTRNRVIRTKIPVPESLPILKRLRKYEPVSMTGQPLVVWDRAIGCHVYDKWGNKWLDWSSCVLVSNAGHGRREIADAVVRQAKHRLLASYCFPTEIRSVLAERLVKLSPREIDKCFLLTTGSETTECAIKLARTYGRSVGGKRKIGIVSFLNAFHGRTMGAQMIGGIPKLKEWIVNLDKDMVQVPFPDGYWNEDTSFEGFLKALRKQKMPTGRIAGVITETYQGGGADFAPKAFMQRLRRWCTKNDIVLILDEVQAAFGRCGTVWGFEQYGIVPDLFCCGKGITSSLPLSAVLGRKKYMDQYGPAEMTSTHTGSPVCAAAALASIDLLVKEKLHRNAARLGVVLQKGLAKIAKKYSDVVGCVHGKGLVAGVHIVKKGKKEKDPDLAWKAVRACVERGLLMFAPVGGSTIKIAPPLTMTKTQMEEGLAVLDEALAEVTGR
ncbi:MAG TPA: aspartate aminotransferase family protein [Planctomycetota bacterium]|nr:aspartate aminotransferase family protein [Planctomycetota bacterium]